MQLQSAMKSFEETLAKFPKCAEGYALYGQVSVFFNPFMLRSTVGNSC